MSNSDELEIKACEHTLFIIAIKKMKDIWKTLQKYGSLGTRYATSVQVFGLEHCPKQLGTLNVFKLIYIKLKERTKDV